MLLLKLGFNWVFADIWPIKSQLMKKSLLTIALLTVASFTFAQLSVGLKGGLNIANFSGDVEDASMRLSFHGGGYVNLSISDRLGLQPELLFNSMGSKFEYTESDPDIGQVDVTETYKLSYISIPVMLMINITDNFNFQLGPQISILASAKGKLEVSGDGFSESIEEDVKDGFKSTDLAVNAGLGVNFGKINASARYSLGLSSISDNDDADVKNGVIQVSLGYRLFGGN
jgi:hypothetical protein